MRTVSVLALVVVAAAGCTNTLYVDPNGNPGPWVPYDAAQATYRARAVFGCSQERITAEWQRKENRHVPPNVGDTDLCGILGRNGVVGKFDLLQSTGRSSAVFTVPGQHGVVQVRALYYDDTDRNRRLGMMVGRWFVDIVSY
jgi:hypothetical protein